MTETMSPSTVKSIRMRLGMSQNELARAVGMTGNHAKRHVRAWESGEEDVPVEIESKIRNLVPEEA